MEFRGSDSGEGDAAQGVRVSQRQREQIPPSKVQGLEYKAGV